MDPLSALFDVIADRVARLMPPRTARIVGRCCFVVMVLLVVYVAVSIVRA